MSQLDELMRQKPEDHDAAPVTFNVEADGVKKPIVAYLWLPSEVKEQSKLHLVIVSHGAGGTALSTANLHLCRGIASHNLPPASSTSEQLAILACTGVSNLKARTKALHAVIEWASNSERVGQVTLAGRSMGCRASAIAYAETLKAGKQHKLSDRLILESYPLEGKGEEARKQVLADLPEHTHVLFVAGANDEMCNLHSLKNTIATDMQANRSLLVVADADHGMNFRRPGRLNCFSKKEVTERLGERAGREAREWLLDTVAKASQCSELSWPEEPDESSNCVWSGWKDDDELQKRPLEATTKRPRDPSDEQMPEQETKRPKRRKKA